MVLEHQNTKLMGKVAIVTGATSGAGLAVAKDLIERGVHVYMIGTFSDEQQRADFMKFLKSYQHRELANYIPQQVRFIEGDATEKEDIKKLIGEAGQRGKIDIIVTNPQLDFGIQGKPSPSVTSEDYRAFAEQATLEASLIMREAKHYLENSSEGVKLFNVCSLHEATASAEHTAYSFKTHFDAATQAITESAAAINEQLKLANDKHQFITISPAFRRTDPAKMMFGKELVEFRRHVSDEKQSADIVRAWLLQDQAGAWVQDETIAKACMGILDGHSITPLNQPMILDHYHRGTTPEHKRPWRTLNEVAFNKEGLHLGPVYKGSSEIEESDEGIGANRSVPQSEATPNNRIGAMKAAIGRVLENLGKNGPPTGLWGY